MLMVKGNGGDTDGKKDDRRPPGGGEEAQPDAGRRAAGLPAWPCGQDRLGQ